MKHYFGLDFGTANTVIQHYKKDWTEPQSFSILEYEDTHSGSPIIPSLIQYLNHSDILVGAQISANQAFADTQSFRWMKHYQLNQNPYNLHCGDTSISSMQAAETFIQSMLKHISVPEYLPSDLGISVPVDAYEHYENWLLQICEQFPFEKIHIIDEASAAAIGCGIQRLPGQIACVIDFGAGTLDVSIVQFDEIADSSNVHQQKCTVLAKSAVSLGGLHIDQWLYEFFLDKFGIERYDPALQPISAALLKACEAVKIQLSDATQQITNLNFDLFPFQTLTLSQIEFHQILENAHFFETVMRTLDNALAALRLKGYVDSDINNIICVGGSSQMPAFMDYIISFFPDKQVITEHAMDAVSRGAALFASGESFFNHIQHDYAIRYYDPAKDSYDYRQLVKKGTPYPSEKSLAEFIIKATYDQQERFGLPIYEINQQAIEIQSQFELFFDPQGAIQLLPLTESEQENRNASWLNEANPTFLYCKHDVSLGQACFKVSFSLDHQKRLLVSSYDMIENEWQVQNHPVIRLH
ncbi:MAG: Hsp70 family protein [Anaerolineaceae bacterium]|nr:Hsp70 family protein [Anaerolineaceae bacterium]